MHIPVPSTSASSATLPSSTGTPTSPPNDSVRKPFKFSLATRPAPATPLAPTSEHKGPEGGDEGAQDGDRNPSAEMPKGASPELPQQPATATPAPTQPPEQSALPAEDDAGAIRRLAALTDLEYDRVRQDEAKKLGVQRKTLDERVNAARKTKEGTGDQLPFTESVPWSEPVTPSDVLNEVAETVHRFVVLRDAEAVACALWVAHTFLVCTFRHSPLLLVNAPEKACAKTLLQEVLALMSCRAVTASNLTLPVIYRSIEEWHPTLFLDEVDTFFRDNKAMHGVVNAGHKKRGAHAWRIEEVGERLRPRPYDVYCAKCLAGIALQRHLSDATMSRGVVVNLRRKLPHESVERLGHADEEVFAVLASKLARFAEDYAERIGHAKPTLPDALTDRDQDNWEPLLAIAECAGPEWFERATT